MGISPQFRWPEKWIKMVHDLHFRILEFPLNHEICGDSRTGNLQETLGWWLVIYPGFATPIAGWFMGKTLKWIIWRFPPIYGNSQNLPIEILYPSSYSDLIPFDGLMDHDSQRSGRSARGDCSVVPPRGSEDWAPGHRMGRPLDHWITSLAWHVWVTDGWWFLALNCFFQHLKRNCLFLAMAGNDWAQNWMVWLWHLSCRVPPGISDPSIDGGPAQCWGSEFERMRFIPSPAPQGNPGGCFPLSTSHQYYQHK